jgi:hypothetical protein
MGMRSRRRRFVVLLFVSALLLAGLSAGPAAAKRHRWAMTPVVLHTHFVQIATGVQDMQLAGRTLLLVTGFAGAGTNLSETLIDDQTGQRTELSVPDCDAPLIGAGWLAFNGAIGNVPSCVTELYSLAGGPPRPIARLGGVVAIGSDWIEYDSNCDEVHFCPTYLFQNLQTGVVKSDPTRTHTIADLNSPVLAHRVCPPLQVPNSSEQLPTARLVPDGRFAIATGVHGVFLERCGTRLHRAIDLNPGPLGASPKAVIWQTTGRKLAGLFLPSLRPFSIKAPELADFELALTPQTLYLRDPEGQVWSAPAPQAGR